MQTGTVSSGGYGPASRKSLAFAFVDADHAEPGRELAVMLFGELRPARVLAGPVVDPENHRPVVDQEVFA